MESSRDHIEAARRAGVREGVARSIAQTFCVVAGLVLVAAGILGFIFGETSFDTGSELQSDEFLGLAVNGWHNVVHILTGLVLLLAAPNAVAAATVALIFGIVYAAIAVWGFMDETILDAIPINDADNWLHVALAAAGILAGAASGALGASGRKKYRSVRKDYDEREATTRTTAGTTAGTAAGTTAGTAGTTDPATERDPNLPPVDTDPRTSPTTTDPNESHPNQTDIDESRRQR